MVASHRISLLLLLTGLLLLGSCKLQRFGKFSKPKDAVHVEQFENVEFEEWEHELTGDQIHVNSEEQSLEETPLIIKHEDKAEIAEDPVEFERWTVSENDKATEIKKVNRRPATADFQDDASTFFYAAAAAILILSYLILGLVFGFQIGWWTMLVALGLTILTVLTALLLHFIDFDFSGGMLAWVIWACFWLAALCTFGIIFDVIAG
jgi:hypothetical protein